MRNLVILIIVILLGALWYFTQSNGMGTMHSNDMSTKQNTQGQAFTVTIPEFTAAARTGETYFNAKCAACHGVNGTGSENGPPLIHKFYKPGHHGDEAFQRAAKLGVQAHHWNFGNMPPVAGITRAEVAKIVIYIREIQKANGL
jgi:mono/diheme cytochrome c family protein